MTDTLTFAVIERAPLAGERARRARSSATSTVAALIAWLVLVAVSARWGEHVVAVGDRLRVHAPPLTGRYEWRVGIGVVPALVVAVLVITFGPRVARGASWPRLLLAVGSASVAWAVALALVDGWGGLTDPLLPGQYLRTVPRVGDPVEFLSHLTARLATYNIHTQGHPPGMVLVLWSLDRLGLGGVTWNAVLVLAGGGAGSVAALVACREVAGPERARAVAPFVVLAPAAIWWTSGDAFFTGVGAWAVTLVVLATGREGHRSDVLALLGGLLFGVVAFLSYGLVLLAAIPVVVAVARRRVRPVAVAVIGSLPVFVAFLGAGFSWVDGLLATRVRYFAGVGGRRPYGYFLVGNLGAFALALGPAIAVALARVRDHVLDRGVWWLVGGALLAVVLADLSGMSRAEVERIWLPFVPWVLLAAVALHRRGDAAEASRAWLVLQAASGVLLQAAVRSPW